MVEEKDQPMTAVEVHLFSSSFSLCFIYRYVLYLSLSISLYHGSSNRRFSQVSPTFDKHFEDDDDELLDEKGYVSP